MAFNNKITGRSMEYIEGVNKTRNYKRRRAEEEMYSKQHDYYEPDDYSDDFDDMVDQALKMLR